MHFLERNCFISIDIPFTEVCTKVFKGQWINCGIYIIGLGGGLGPGRRQGISRNNDDRVHGTYVYTVVMTPILSPPEVRRSPLWQPTVPPATTKLTSWHLSVFSDKWVNGLETFNVVYSSVLIFASSRSPHVSKLWYGYWPRSIFRNIGKIL